MNSFYTRDELKSMKFKALGENVLISRFARIYNIENICIGNSVRIDDFCILSGSIKIGSYIHISAYTALFAGDYGINIEDFSTLSSRVAVYAVTDDYSGNYMTNPMVGKDFNNITGGLVQIMKHAIIGTGTTVLPSVTINEGAAIGAMSLVNRDISEWTINVGIPCKKINKRSENAKTIEKNFIR